MTSRPGEVGMRLIFFNLQPDFHGNPLAGHSLRLQAGCSATGWLRVQSRIPSRNRCRRYRQCVGERQPSKKHWRRFGTFTSKPAGSPTARVCSGSENGKTARPGLLPIRAGEPHRRGEWTDCLGRRSKRRRKLYTEAGHRGRLVRATAIIREFYFAKAGRTCSRLSTSDMSTDLLILGLSGCLEPGSGYTRTRCRGLPISE